ncbi:unnamed protein product [Amoebophrya sp. A120]|nr:unnamed protein product [Amoebophrya sp. A120]|eukprot:GSA120T00003774001.1
MATSVLSTLGEFLYAAGPGFAGPGTVRERHPSWVVGLSCFSFWVNAAHCYFVWKDILSGVLFLLQGSVAFISDYLTLLGRDVERTLTSAEGDSTGTSTGVVGTSSTTIFSSSVRGNERSRKKVLLEEQQHQDRDSIDAGAASSNAMPAVSDRMRMRRTLPIFTHRVPLFCFNHKPLINRIDKGIACCIIVWMHVLACRHLLAYPLLTVPPLALFLGYSRLATTQDDWICRHSVWHVFATCLIIVSVHFAYLYEHEVCLSLYQTGKPTARSALGTGPIKNCLLDHLGLNREKVLSLQQRLADGGGLDGSETVSEGGELWSLVGPLVWNAGAPLTVLGIIVALGS